MVGSSFVDSFPLFFPRGSIPRFSRSSFLEAAASLAALAKRDTTLRACVVFFKLLDDVARAEAIGNTTRGHPVFLCLYRLGPRVRTRTKSRLRLTRRYEESFIVSSLEGTCEGRHLTAHGIYVTQQNPPDCILWRIQSFVFVFFTLIF